MDSMEARGSGLVVVPNTNQVNSYDCLISEPFVPVLTQDERDSMRELIRPGFANTVRATELDRLERRLVVKMLDRNRDIWSYYDSFSKYIDDTSLKKILSSVQTLNSSWHENLSALITAQLLPLVREGTKPNTVIGSVVSQAQVFSRIRRENVFRGYDVMSVKTSEGITMVGKNNANQPMYVIKTPKSEDRDTLAHEAVVGLTLNTIRDKIPNFMYTYSYTNCSPPVLEKTSYSDPPPGLGIEKIPDKEVAFDFCSDDSKSSVLILELISNANGTAPNLYEWARNHSAEELDEVLRQINYALKYANQKLGFVHGDLYSGNVLVRTFEDPVPLPGGRTSKHVPVIIDYGFSTIKIDGVDFPSTSEVVSQYIGSDYLDSSVASIDMYHLLLTLARDSNFTVGSRHNVISKLFSELGYGNLSQKLNEIRPMSAEDVTDDDWLEFWGYYIPSPIERNINNRPVMPDPPDLWSEILTTCDFTSSLINYSVQVETLVDLWYLLYGTSLKNISEEHVRNLMIGILEQYNPTTLLIDDVEYYNDHLDRVIPLAEKFGPLSAENDENVWIEMIRLYRDLVDVHKDIHVLSTVAKSIQKYKDLGPVALKSLFDLEKRLTSDMISTYTEVLYSRYIEVISENWNNPSPPWNEESIKEKHPFWSESNYNRIISEFNNNLLPI